MTMPINYNEDATQLEVTYRQKKMSVPVEVVDFLIGNHLPQFMWDEILEFRQLSIAGAVDGVPVPPRTAQIKDLVGADLTGTTIHFQLGSYDLVDYYSLDTVKTVVKEEDDDDSYRFSFGEEMDALLAKMELADTDEQYDAAAAQIPRELQRLTFYLLSGEQEVKIVFFSTD